MVGRASVILLLATLGVRWAAAEPPAVHPIALPGAPPGGMLLDYLAYDRAHRRVWVPAGDTGSVDVVDVAGDRVTRITGFPAARGPRRRRGPTAAAVGDGVVYIGNTADASVCVVDARTLRRGPCVTLSATPDGLAWVAARRELWITAPQARSILILAAAASGVLAQTATISLDGRPEGFAVDDERGVFYTNLADGDRTLTIDLAARRVTQMWSPGCGAAGPRGLALDRTAEVLLVACGDHVVALDAGHGGRPLSALATGAGLDNLGYVAATRLLYAAAAGTGTLTVAHLDAGGVLTRRALVPTAAGARNAVATDEGTAYLADARRGRLLVVTPAAGAGGASASRSVATRAGTRR